MRERGPLPLAWTIPALLVLPAHAMIVSYPKYIDFEPFGDLIFGAARYALILLPWLTLAAIITLLVRENGSPDYYWTASRGRQITLVGILLLPMLVYLNPFLLTTLQQQYGYPTYVIAAVLGLFHLSIQGIITAAVLRPLLDGRHLAVKGIQAVILAYLLVFYALTLI